MVPQIVYTLKVGSNKKDPASALVARLRNFSPNPYTNKQKFDELYDNISQGTIFVPLGAIRETVEEAFRRLSKPLPSLPYNCPKNAKILIITGLEKRTLKEFDTSREQHQELYDRVMEQNIDVLDESNMHLDYFSRQITQNT